MANTDLAKRCLRLKDEIENDSIESAKNKGRLDATKKNIKEEFDVNTIGKAKTALADLEHSFEIIKEQMDEVLVEVETIMENND